MGLKASVSRLANTEWQVTIVSGDAPAISILNFSFLPCDDGLATR